MGRVRDILNNKVKQVSDVMPPLTQGSLKRYMTLTGADKVAKAIGIEFSEGILNKGIFTLHLPRKTSIDKKAIDALVKTPKFIEIYSGDTGTSISFKTK